MAVLEHPNIAVSDATPEHLPGVMRLENIAFPTPWSEEALAREIGHFRATFRVAFEPRLGLHRVAGYLLSWRVVDECHILKIAVDESCRRAGIGSALLADTMATQAAGGAKLAYLEVRPSNIAGVAFYESHGFDRIGVRPNYYTDTREDALLFFRALP